MNTPSVPRRLLSPLSLLVLAACGSDTTAPGGGGPAISVAVVPASASLLTSGSQDFTATVANDPSHSGVTWSITGCSGGALVCGSLSNVTSTAVTYTAPATVPPGTLGVTAAAVSDNSKSVTARVAITAIAAAGQIAFRSTRDGSLYSIYLMNADGSGPRSLTSQPASCLSWSPDGSQVAFGSYVAGGTYDLYVMNAEGSGVRNLTNGLGCDPAWSPDGTKIAFDSDRDGNTVANTGIYVMNADGSGVRRLTDPGGDYGAAWSPEGSQIAFTRHRNGEDEIWVMNADGSGLRNLTNNPTAQDVAPAWRPRGP